MADKISFMVDLSGLANWAPTEGIGSSSLLKMDGLYSAIITKATLGKSAAGNNKFILSLAVQDADEKGATLIADVLLSGQDKNGNLNVRKFGELLHSIGMSMEQVRQFAANGQQPGEGLGNTITGKTVYCSVEAETYNGNARSRVQNFVAPQQYNDAVSANAHRKPRKADTSFVSAPATSTSTVSTPAVNLTTNGAVMGGTAAATTKVTAVDPMSRLAGLNLPV